jgi:hypothetical protein
MILLAALAFSGCGLKTVDQLYCLPKRSQAYNNLQAVIDEAMDGLIFSAPVYGSNRQTVQVADLDGDGVDEYLLFAKDNSEKPLKILIFCQLASGYVLMDTIEGYGFAFDFVEYAQMDDRPGVEIIVGRQVSDQVARAVSVYRFSSGFSRQLLSTGYSRLSTCDLDRDGKKEIFLLTYGADESGKGLVALYSYRDGEMHRSAEQNISNSAAGFRRFTAGALQNGTLAMFVTCEKDEQTMITDIFVMNDGQLSATARGVTTQALNDYHVFPADVDNDGILEMAHLLPLPNTGSGKRQYLLQWYSLDEDGQETVKVCTYHNYSDGWFLKVEKEQIEGLAVEQTEETTIFSRVEKGQKTPMLVIEALTDADREEKAKQEGRVILYKGDAVIYTAQITEEAKQLGLTKEVLSEAFYPIRAELMTEED